MGAASRAARRAGSEALRRWEASYSSGRAGIASPSPVSRAPPAHRLADIFPKKLVDDIYRSSFKSQTGVSLKYMMDFGQNPVSRQLLLSAQFLHEELPTRLAHRVMELEGLPFGLSFKPQVLKVRPRETWFRPTSSVDRREADDGP